MCLFRQERARFRISRHRIAKKGLAPAETATKNPLCTSMPKPRTDRTCVDYRVEMHESLKYLQISSNPSHLFRLFASQFRTLLFSVSHIFGQAYAKAKNCQHLTGWLDEWLDSTEQLTVLSELTLLQVRPLYDPWLSRSRCELPTSEIKIESMETFLQKAQWNSKPHENEIIVNAVFTCFPTAVKCVLEVWCITSVTGPSGKHEICIWRPQISAMHTLYYSLYITAQAERIWKRQTGNGRTELPDR